MNTHNIFFSGATSGLTVDEGRRCFFIAPLSSLISMLMSAWGSGPGLCMQHRPQSGPLLAFDASDGLSWADQMIGARYHRDLGSGFSATAYGGVGGFGDGAHIDWQLLGTIDYAVNSQIELHGGFRSLMRRAPTSARTSPARSSALPSVFLQAVAAHTDRRLLPVGK